MHDMIVLRNVILYIVSLPLIELPSLFDGGVNRVHLVKLTGFSFTYSMFFLGKQIAGITALLYYIPCTLFSPFTDLMVVSKAYRSEQLVIAVHLV